MKGARSAKDVFNDKISLYSTTSIASFSGVKPLRKRYSAGEPIPETDNKGDSIAECCPLETDGKGNFVDRMGRKIVLKGINLDGALKLPVTPDLPTYVGDSSDPKNFFFDGENVLFVGRPFPLEEAEFHFKRIKSWGYNTIRFLITWEALEHKGPGKYDDDYIDYTIKILRIINKVGGLYVFLETHQDVWSRFSGGSGAPMWTFYAAGLQPRRFAPTEAAILHNEARFHRKENPDRYHKMVWTTNYRRLAALVMFTAFFAGNNFFPKCKINDENIQFYLQRHYFNAIEHFWTRVTKELPEMLENGSLVGFELINEPCSGLIGYENMEVLPASQHLRVGTTPTVFEAMKLGMGLACEVEVYRITISGPLKSNTTVIDPKGEMAWLTPTESKFFDIKYNWKRDPSWVIGECLFAQHGIWKWDDDVDFSKLSKLSELERVSIGRRKTKMLIPNYFNEVQKNHNFSKGIQKLDLDFFTNNNFVDFYLSFKKTIRSVTPEVFVFIQPPVLAIPPDLKRDHRHIIDSKTIYTPHYYDGMSLLFKTWNSKYNVDTLGIMRGRYYNPVMGIVFGDKAIRNCIKKQFLEMRRECEQYLGSIPVLMSETGMPFDMDNKKSYDDGKYLSQTAALDALSNALEGLNMSHTYWCYTSVNCHKWGDRWNNEDFSFWSPEDRNLVLSDELLVSDSSAPNSNSNSGNSSRRPLAVVANFKTSMKSASRKYSDSTTTLKSKIRDHSSRLSDLGKTANRNGSHNGDHSIPEESNVISPIQENISNDEMPKFNTNFSFDKEKSTEGMSDIQSIQSTLISCTSSNIKSKHNRKCYPSPDGVRAVSAIIRPYAMATSGEIVNSEFDMKGSKFTLCIKVDKDTDEIADSPTIVFVPKWHYPYLNYGDIYLSSGYVKYNERLEYLEWYHNEDDSEITKSIVEGVTEETLILKNHSGTLEEVGSRESTFPNPGDIKCPVT